MKHIIVPFSFCWEWKKKENWVTELVCMLSVSLVLQPYLSCSPSVSRLMDWQSVISLGFFVLYKLFTECSLVSSRNSGIHTVFTCYSTALLNPKSNRSSLQLATGVNIVFQIFILYFYLLHYVDGINILVLNLIIVLYTFLTNLFCCFTPEIAKINMSPESVIVHMRGINHNSMFKVVLKQLAFLL